MKFYERWLLENETFQSLTTLQQRNYLSLTRHVNICSWVVSIYMSVFSLLCFLIGIVGLTLLLFNVNRPIALYILTLFALLIVIPWIIIPFKFGFKKKEADEIYDFFEKALRNLWLLDGRVVNLKDWHYVRKFDKEAYNTMRSDKCHGCCYQTTFILANILKNPNVKILWISISMNGEYGHAVLLKNGNIYDSNLRRTFSAKKYFKLYNAELFKEFSLTDYCDSSFNENHFTKLGWEDFGEWCKSRNVVRNT